MQRISEGEAALDIHRAGGPVFLDVSRLLWRAWDRRLPTGIDRTCLAYVAHFGDRARAVVQQRGFTRVLPAALSRWLFALLLEPSADVRRRLARLAPGGLLGRMDAPLAGAVYLNVGHTGLDRPGHAAWVRRTGVRPIYFVHDLIPLTHPEYCRPGEPEKHLERMKALASLGNGIVANSHDTLAQLTRFVTAQQGSVMPPALVAPLGVARVKAGPSAGALVDVCAGPSPTRPYFVMLGTIEGRKNHLLMLTLWAELARRLGEACPQLVIIGQRGWESEQAVDMLERSEVIKGHVIELSRCDDALLGAYMRGARALLFPSFVEGYGLPLTEALTCRTPVIASDLPVFRELAGNIPDYFSPIDGLGWLAAIEDYVRPHSSMRAEQIARMSGWSSPRWETHFAQVDDWLAGLDLRP